MKLESLKNGKFEKLTQNQQKNINGGEIANSGAGSKATGKTRTGPDGRIQTEYMSWSTDCVQTFHVVGGEDITSVTYSGTCNTWR